MCWHPSMTTLILILALFQTAQDLYNSAATDFEAGRWAEAAMKYESVLKEDNSHIPSRFNLAVCYTKLGNTDAAIAAYRTLLDQNGTIYEARVNLAILLDQSGKRVEAGEQFDRALSLRPDDVQAELNLAMFYMRGNEIDKAYPHLIAVQAKGLSSAELYVALARPSTLDRMKRSPVNISRRPFHSIRKTRICAGSWLSPISPTRIMRKRFHVWLNSSGWNQRMPITFTFSENRTSR